MSLLSFFRRSKKKRSQSATPRCPACRESPCTFNPRNTAIPVQDFDPDHEDVPEEWCKCCLECVMMQAMEWELRGQEARGECEVKENRWGVRFFGY